MKSQKRMRWSGHVVCTGVKRSAYKILVDMPERERPLEKPMCTWEVKKKKGKAILVTGHEAHRVVSRRGSHIF
jgi:hypothetical protein